MKEAELLCKIITIIVCVLVVASLLTLGMVIGAKFF